MAGARAAELSRFDIPRQPRSAAVGTLCSPNARYPSRLLATPCKLPTISRQNPGCSSKTPRASCSLPNFRRQMARLYMAWQPRRRSAAFAGTCWSFWQQPEGSTGLLSKCSGNRKDNRDCPEHVQINRSSLVQCYSEPQSRRDPHFLLDSPTYAAHPGLGVRRI